MPFLATLSATGIEALGCWRVRNGILCFEAILLAGSSVIGALLGGLTGAVIGVITQRIVSGLVGFLFLGKMLGKSTISAFTFLLKLYAPFILSCVSLSILNIVFNHADNDLILLGPPLVKTFGSLVIYMALTWWWNKEILKTVMRLIIARFARPV